MVIKCRLVSRITIYKYARPFWDDSPDHLWSDRPAKFQSEQSVHSALPQNEVPKNCCLIIFKHNKYHKLE